MAKTVFIDGDPSLGIAGTIVNAAFLNALNNHRHDGLDQDGHGVLDYAVSTGAAGAYVIELTPALAAQVPGMPIFFKANHENAGAVTLKIDDLDAVAIKDGAGNDLLAGNIKSGQVVVVAYDGTYFQMLSVPGSGFTPVGEVIMWPNEDPPDGWLECDGASLSRETYATLFAVLGTLYGAADETHFNLPDYRGRFLRGWAHGSANDPDRAARTAPTATGATIVAGDHVGTEQADEVEAHTHTGGPVKQSTTAAGSATTSYWRIDSNGDAESGSTGGNETRPVNSNVMFCIKY